MVRNDTENLFLSDAEALMKSLALDFPDQIKLRSIGQSWQNRSLNLLEITSNIPNDHTNLVNMSDLN